MIVTTKHGEFEVRDLTQKERRKHFRKVKEVFKTADILLLHDLADEFALFAFNNPDEALKGLSATAEDEVLMDVINQYMGFDLKNASGD